MEYKEKYEKALERARKIHNETEFDYEKGMMEEVFPELKESEDERIRKEIEQLIQCMHNADPRKERWLAWLEKQGSQDNANRVDEAMKELEEKIKMFSENHKGENAEELIKEITEEGVMTQENKQLLLKDLCMRLPYNIVCQFNDTQRIFYKKIPLFDYFLSEEHIKMFRRCNDFFIKPYLRPLSSMTEEERKEWRKLLDIHETDWLNEHHFDYRGLIEKGLAIRVTKSNNPYK